MTALTEREKVSLSPPPSPEQALHTDIDTLARELLQHQWRPEWADAGWTEQFSEAWRRLVVRLYIGGILTKMEDPSGEIRRLDQLSQITFAASQSFAIARLMMAEYLPEAGPPPEDEPTPPSGVRVSYPGYSERW